MYEEHEKFIQHSFRKHEWKRSLCRGRPRWEVNVKMNLT